MKNGSDATLPLTKIFDKISDLFTRSPKYNPKMKVEHRAAAFDHSGKRDDRKLRGTVIEDDTEAELNRILDKIKSVGYDKLSSAEKNFLNKVSNE
jgi:hypothetical protein